MLDGVPARTCIVPFEARDHVVRETDVASVGITIADDDVNDPLFDTVHGWRRTHGLHHPNGRKKSGHAWEMSQLLRCRHWIAARRNCTQGDDWRTPNSAFAPSGLRRDSLRLWEARWSWQLMELTPPQPASRSSRDARAKAGWVLGTEFATGW